MTTTRLDDDAAEALDNYLDSPGTPADLTKTDVVSDAVLDAIPDDHHPTPETTDAADAVADGGIEDYNARLRENWDPDPIDPAAVDNWDDTLRETWRIRVPALLAWVRHTHAGRQLVDADDLRDLIDTHLNVDERTRRNYIYKYPNHEAVPDDAFWVTPPADGRAPMQQIERRVTAMLSPERQAEYPEGIDDMLYEGLRLRDKVSLAGRERIAVMLEGTVDSLLSEWSAMQDPRQSSSECREALALYLQWLLKTLNDEGWITVDSGVVSREQRALTMKATSEELGEEFTQWW